MQIYNIFSIFIFGAIIGSFINVFVLRYNTGLSFVKGRSKCFSCNKILTSKELIPIFSFIALKGKCSSCHTKISKQYLFVELITAIAFVLIFLKIGLNLFLPIYLLIFSLLISISVYDFLHKIIPDGMVYAFIIISASFWISSGASIYGLLSAIILFLFFAGLWFVSGGKWMGFGDSKIAVGAGFLLGLTGGISAITLAFWIGAIISIILIIIQKLNIKGFGLTIKSEIPFAPFIILGIFLQFFTNFNLFYLFLK